MPNWCENKLVVKGKSEELVKFIEKHVVDGELDYKTFDLRKRLFGENYFDTAQILNEGQRKSHFGLQPNGVQLEEKKPAMR